MALINYKIKLKVLIAITQALITAITIINIRVNFIVVIQQMSLNKANFEWLATYFTIEASKNNFSYFVVAL